MTGVQHSLAIHRIRASLALTGRQEDAAPLGREVGRSLGDLLPAAAARVLQPLLGSRDGVLRIDRIGLRLRLGRAELSAPHLAELLAREIARAIDERAAGPDALPRTGNGVAYWPDHASFAAAYLALRLRLRAAPGWAFPDFRPLDHLAPEEAALELVAARPVILGALARLLDAGGMDVLATSLPEATAARLVQRVAAGVEARHLADDVLAELAGLLAWLPEGAEASPGRAAVAAAAAALSTGAAPEAAAVRRTVALARLAVALVALRATMLATSGRLPDASDLAPEALEDLPGAVRDLAAAALAPLPRDEALRAGLARLLAPAARRKVAAGAAPSRSIASRFAGIGLLLPAALAYGLPGQLSPAALHRTLAAALGSDVAGMARLDPLLAALAPCDPRAAEPGFPPVPEALRGAVPAARRDADGEAAREGAAGWGACLVHAFAAGLRGFEGSSLGYLRRQFLARPGTLQVMGERLILVLDPMPLGILLRLHGLHGWSGGLPHLREAVLRIELREG